MGRKSRLYGGLIGIVGFLLSPLSWWNDLFINIPLALGFAWLVALVYKPAFEAALIFGYWLTNVLGFILLHKGIHKALGRGEHPMPEPHFTWRRDLLISLAYTLLMVLLIKLKILQPLAHSFTSP